MSGFKNSLRITSLTGLAFKLGVLDFWIQTSVIEIQEKLPSLQLDFNESPARAFKVGRNTFKVFAFVKCSNVLLYTQISLEDKHKSCGICISTIYDSWTIHCVSERDLIVCILHLAKGPKYQNTLTSESKQNKSQVRSQFAILNWILSYLFRQQHQ